MSHAVIAGAGIAGIPAAYALKSRLGPNGQVTVVSDRDYFNSVHPIRGSPSAGAIVTILHSPSTLISKPGELTLLPPR